MSLKSKLVRSQTVNINWAVFVSFIICCTAFVQWQITKSKPLSTSPALFFTAYSIITCLLLIARITCKSIFALLAFWGYFLTFVLNAGFLLAHILPTAAQNLIYVEYKVQIVMFLIYNYGMTFLLNMLVLYLFYKAYKATRLIKEIQRQIVRKDLSTSE